MRSEMSGLENPQDAVLDAFLNARRSEGRYFDTSSFTIDSVRAMQKLSLHQLPESGLWLVKIVQAAVASGADSVSITFGRKLARVAFRPTHGWQADELLETVLSGNLPQDRALMHLVTGIRASSVHLSESVSWSCGRARVVLSPSACQVNEQEDSPSFSLEATRPSRSRSVSQTLTAPLTQLIKQTVEESDALNARCWVCPIPITVDGRPLDRGYDLPNAGHVEDSPLRLLRSYSNAERNLVTACLGIRPLDWPSYQARIPYFTRPWPVTQKAAEEPRRAKPLYAGETFLRWSPATESVSGAVAVVSGAKERHARIHFVLDGAVVASHEIPSWEREQPGFFGKIINNSPNLGVKIILGIEPGDLDLSQFAVRQLELERLGESLRPEVEALAKAILARLGECYYVPVSRKTVPLASVGVGAQVALVGAVSNGVMLLPFAGVVTVVVTLNAMMYRSQVKGAVQALLKNLASPPGDGSIDITR